MTTSLPRRCLERTARGEPCRQSPITDRDRCFWHDPEYAEQAKEARRMGGRRRRREHVIGGSHDLDGLDHVSGIRRLLELAVIDTIQLENSNARARTLIQIAKVASDLLKAGELEVRIIALEEVTKTARK